MCHIKQCLKPSSVRRHSGSFFDFCDEPTRVAHPFTNIFEEFFRNASANGSLVSSWGESNLYITSLPLINNDKFLRSATLNFKTHKHQVIKVLSYIILNEAAMPSNCSPFHI